jgi:hypothetical protein
MKKFLYKFPRLCLVLQYFIMHFLTEHTQFLITQESAVVSRTCISYFIQENVHFFLKKLSYVAQYLNNELTSGMWYHVFQLKITKFLEEHPASIFRE